MRRSIYISLSLTFILVSILVYCGTFIIPRSSAIFSQDELDSLYFNICSLYRFFFVLGSLYMAIFISEDKPFYILVWLLKWILAFLTGAQLVRFVGNILVDGTVTKTELSIYVIGLVVTIFMAIKEARK